MQSSEILITGANGQLGQALKAHYPEAQTADINQLDITNPASVAEYDWNSVKVVVNAAAYTKVDDAETTEGRIAAWKVNATAVGYLAQAALKHDLTLVHISTDYVFDGTQNPHTEDEPLSPLSVYGQTKAAGDIAVSEVAKHYLLRTSWVIGEGKNFVNIMLGLADRGIAPTVVSDQIGRLTFTSELVKAIDHLLTTEQAYGTYNLTNGGDSVSWADITREIFRLGGYDLAVTDSTTADYFANKPEAAPRPLLSTLSLDKIQATGFQSTDWRDDLQTYVNKQLETRS